MTIRSSNRAGPVWAALTLVTLALGPAMAAPVTFGQYFQSNGSQQQWTVSTTGGVTTVTATGAVLFKFSGVSVPFSSPETANFTLTATSAQVGNCGVSCGPGDSFVQPGYTGTFSFTDTGLFPGTNLLSGTFAVTGSPATTGAQFSSSIGGTGGSFNASATAGNLNQLVFTSAYLSFAGQTQEDASWSLSSLIPNFAVGTVTLNQAFPAAGPFNASGTGTFSSNPGPSGTPEPASLGLIGGGLCTVAWIMRRRQRRLRLRR
jgi:hypothetical protein